MAKPAPSQGDEPFVIERRMPPFGGGASYTAILSRTPTTEMVGQYRLNCRVENAIGADEVNYIHDDPDEPHPLETRIFSGDGWAKKSPGTLTCFSCPIKGPN